MRFCLAFLISLWVAVAHAQVGGTAIAVLDAPSTVMTFPLDINGAAYAFWSTRCGAKTYAGNLMDVTDSATGNTTGTRLQCSAGGVISSLVSGAACTFVTGNACSPLATTCATACNVRTVYDQSGATNCTTACDATQATNASRPTLTQNCQNGKICLTVAATTMSTSALSAAQAQPLTGSFVATRTGSTAAVMNAMGGSGANIQLGFSNAASTLSMFGGGAFAATAALYTEAIPHAVQGVFNGASSAIFIDGAAGTLSVNPGATGFTTGGGEILGLAGCPCNALTGKWFEDGWWAGDKSANNFAMNSSQRIYWNF